ncbi:MAG: SIS domain-containing protein [Treponema sp.]|jgi:tagatose-6-phosphate ketose/aldose isomerase|nr:SIS domain-containing protein [Treponema sp.]
MKTCKIFYELDEAFFKSKNSFSTASEISRQPDLWRDLCGILEARKAEIVSFLERIGNLQNMRIILTGAGSSAHIGETLSFIIGKTSKIRCEAIATTDIVSSPRSVLFPNVPTLLVSFARSGSSPESTGAVQYARSIVKDLWELALVCDGASALAKLTSESPKSMTLVMPEGSNDNGFAMTSSVSCMLLSCFAFFNSARLEEIRADIVRLSDMIEKEASRLTGISRRWAEKNYERLIVIGSGCCKGIAKEAALKSMELTAGTVNTNYESSLGFRHGPKAVIKDNTLTIHLVSPDPLSAKYDLDLVREISRQKKGNRIIALSTDALAVETDENLVIPALNRGADGELYFGISCLVFCQLLAMFKSISLGLPTDNPVPTGELTRVVSGVTLYDLDS